MGVFRACPVPTMRPSAGLPKDQKGLQQGSNSESAEISPFSAQNRLENNCESSSLRDDLPKIPCATEQGINSSRTGNRFALNSELIRHNRESGAKSRRTRVEPSLRHRSEPLRRPPKHSASPSRGWLARWAGDT